jgi:hypothetical protein
MIERILSPCANRPFATAEFDALAEQSIWDFDSISTEPNRNDGDIVVPTKVIIFVFTDPPTKVGPLPPPSRYEKRNRMSAIIEPDQNSKFFMI